LASAEAQLSVGTSISTQLLKLREKNAFAQRALRTELFLTPLYMTRAVMED
jgi:hypothetical protein